MSVQAILRASACIPFCLAGASAWANEPQSTSETDANLIVITAPRGIAAATPTSTTVTTATAPATGPDATALLARQPGMARIGNGALSGQVQMRGMFGERIALHINGQHFASGGPNAMDPALHYAPLVLVDRIELPRGVVPVRDGPGLGGGANAVLKEVGFADGDQLAPVIDLTAAARSSDSSWGMGGVAGLASDRWRLGLLGAWEQGSDQRFPGGTIAGTSHRRAVYGINAGMRAGPGELGLEYRRQETGASGNPPFAMDIVWFHTDFARLTFAGDLAAGVRVEARAGYAAVDHRMNNFSLRPMPAVAQQRQSDTEAQTLTGGLAVRLGSAARHLRIGGDIELIDKGFRLYNPASPAFWLTPIAGGTTRRVGAHAEWRGGLAPVEFEAGIRVDRHGAAVAAPGVGSAVPAGPRGLAAGFAAGPREWAGTTVDAALRLWADMGAITPRLTLARKTRVPSLVERYSWLPTEASGGLADGNIYVGDPRLKPEVAWLAELGFDISGSGFYARPAVFYRRLDDYIQGVAFDATPGVINSAVEMVAAASGDPTPLRFANVDARLWGADLAFGGPIAGPLRIDGVASMVRGDRRDVPDRLYRIAPDSLRIALGWEARRWGLAIEGEAVAAQSRVSVTNGETRTAGHVLAALRGYWLPAANLRIDAGIENLFDRRYADHLGGINRNPGGNVPVGARLPGAGRSAFVRARLTMP